MLRGKMRSFVVFGVVTLCLTMNSYAVPRAGDPRTSSPNKEIKRDDPFLLALYPRPDLTTLFLNVERMCSMYRLRIPKRQPADTSPPTPTNETNFVVIIDKVCEAQEYLELAKPTQLKCDVISEEMEQGQQLVADLVESFSIDVFTVMNLYGKKSKAFSPLNYLSPLSMLSYGKQEKTRNTFLNMIGVSKNKTHMAKFGFRTLVKKLAYYDVRMNTKIFVSPNVTLESYFVDVADKIFNASIQAVNLTNGVMDSRKINKWIASQTNNSLTGIFEPLLEPTGRSPKIVVANTVYFEGAWDSKKGAYDWGSEPFHLGSGRQVEKTYIHMVDIFRHGRVNGSEAQFVEVPFKKNPNNTRGGDMSMYFIYSDNEESESWKLLRQLRPESLMNALSNGTRKEVYFYVPKFTLESEVSIEDAFPNLSDLYFPSNEEPRHYPIISNSSRSLNIGAAESKVVIDVNVQGIKIAGSSVVQPGIFDDTSESERQKREPRAAGHRAYTVQESFELVAVDLNRPFIAIVVAKGETMTPIFFINFTGR